MESVLGSITSNGKAALAIANTATGIQRSDQRLVYPGSDKREMSLWYISQNTEQTVIIAGAPEAIKCFRTACGIRQPKAGSGWNRPSVQARLQRSTRWGVDEHGLDRANPNANDLYDDTFSAHETWLIIPVIQKREVLDEAGNVVMLRNKDGSLQPKMRDYFRFVELPAKCPQAKVLMDTLGSKFFSSKSTGLVGAWFKIKRGEERGNREGTWELITQESANGSRMPKYTDPQKLIQQIMVMANKKLTDEDKRRGGYKLYFSTISQAYPYAKQDEQRAVLAVHKEVITGNPDFASGFPAVKSSAASTMLNSSGYVMDEGASIGDDGTGVSTSLDAVDQATDNAGDNSEVSFGETAAVAEEPATDEAGSEEPAGETEEEVSSAAETPADATEEVEEEVSEEAGEAAGEEAGEEASAGEDGQQDDGPVDVTGRVSAFDLSDEDIKAFDKPVKPAAKAAPKPAPKPAAAAPAAKAAPKPAAPAPKPATKTAAKPAAKKG